MVGWRGALGALVLAVAMLLPGVARGQEKFGMVFDVQGKATLTSQGGQPVALSKGKDLLRPVMEGDTIEVAGAGKVIVVSLSGGKGFEIGSDTKATVQAGALKATKGSVQVRDGFAAPTRDAKGPIGAIVLRSITKDHCIKLIHPVGTSVDTASPSFQWQSTCKPGSELVLKVLDGRQIIHEAKLAGSTYTTTEGVLQYDKTYRWMVETTSDASFVGGAFYIVPVSVSQEVQLKRAAYMTDTSDLIKRIDYIQLLETNGIDAIWQKEITALKTDFPESQFVQSLQAQ